MPETPKAATVPPTKPAVAVPPLVSPIVPPSGLITLTVTPAIIHGPPGARVQIHAIVNDARTHSVIPHFVTYRSDNGRVAEVTPSGEVKLGNPGSTLVRVAAGKATDVIAVTVG